MGEEIGEYVWGGKCPGNVWGRNVQILMHN